MSQVDPPTIVTYFSNLSDPRVLGRTQHKLIDIITIAVCAVISGANGWVEIETYGKSKQSWFERFLELPNGIPTQYTFRRVFIALSPDELESCFLQWVKAMFTVANGQVVPIDGKTLRGSHDRSAGKAPIHMVSAWASENGICLGQIKTEDKSNEITAIPELIKRLDLQDCTVTIDAMGCQTAIAEEIVNKGADYILALKGNQSNLRDNVQLFFEDAKQSGFKDISYDDYETIDGEHGRIETRKIAAVSELNWLQGKEKWKGLTSIIMVDSEREVNDERSQETRYYISSLGADAHLLADSIRSHWGIENSLHWRLDVGFREDECRIRKGNGARNFAVLRHIALNLLNQEKTMKTGVKPKRLRAGWDNEYLRKVING